MEEDGKCFTTVSSGRPPTSSRHATLSLTVPFPPLHQRSPKTPASAVTSSSSSLHHQLDPFTGAPSQLLHRAHQWLPLPVSPSSGLLRKASMPAAPPSGTITADLLSSSLRLCFSFPPPSTTSTYNILMDAYSRRMQPEIVEDLLLEMQGLGLKPNVKSYTCLISAYGRQKKMSEKATASFLRMKAAGIKPTSHSYTALIHTYSISGWHEKAYAAYENIRREGIVPSIETYTALLDAFRRGGETKVLMEI